MNETIDGFGEGHDSANAQRERVLKELTKAGAAGVLAWDLARMCNVPCISKRISELRKAGVDIASELCLVERGDGGSALVRYVLQSPDAADADPWSLQGEADDASRTLTGEEVAMLRSVRGHLEATGARLYQWTHRAWGLEANALPLRYGFRRVIDDEDRTTPASVEYLVLTDAWPHVCQGFNPRAVAKVLQARGHLAHMAGRLVDAVRLPGMGIDPVPVIRVKPSIFHDAA